MVYLDNAATSFPKPQLVYNSVIQAVEIYGGNPGRGGHKFSMKASEKIFEARKKVAAFFGTSVPINRVVFTSNCTMSLNIAIKGILKEGDHVITSCLEHNSSIRPIRKLAQRGQITFDIASVGMTDEETINEFKMLINSRTKAIVCTHASNVTGRVMPIRALGKLCKAHNITLIVDAAQTAGVLPINMEDMNIDILCTAGHKGLYGITGTGVLVFGKDVEFDTIIEGGTGSFSSLPYQPEEYPDRLESGTANTAGILSIGAGIDYINSIGIKKLYNTEFAHCKKVYDALSSIAQVELYCDDMIQYKNTPTVAFNVIGRTSEEIVAELNEKGFALRGGLHCAPLAHEFYNTLDVGMVRFSPSYFTREQSVENFVAAVKKIIKNKLI